MACVPPDSSSAGRNQASLPGARGSASPRRLCPHTRGHLHLSTAEHSRGQDEARRSQPPVLAGGVCLPGLGRPSARREQRDGVRAARGPQWSMSARNNKEINTSFLKWTKHPLNLGQNIYHTCLITVSKGFLIMGLFRYLIGRSVVFFLIFPGSSFYSVAIHFNSCKLQSYINAFSFTTTHSAQPTYYGGLKSFS